MVPVGHRGVPIRNDCEEPTGDEAIRVSCSCLHVHSGGCGLLRFARNDSGFCSFVSGFACGIITFTRVLRTRRAVMPVVRKHAISGNAYTKNTRHCEEF